MPILQKMFQKKVGKIVGGLVGGLIIMGAASGLRGFFGATDAEAASGTRVFVCSDTGKSFSHALARGDSIPLHSPFSNRDTGYPAEVCYWTREGTVRNEPVPVLLNDLLGKSSPTFCPDCGRLVVGHNPVAHAGSTPPPTQEQYARSHRKTGTLQARIDEGR
jgi:hypothetical protein